MSPVLWFALGGSLLLLEGLSRRQLKRWLPDHWGTRMEPHIFSHFLPSRSFSDITPEGFRKTDSGPPQGTAAKSLYLAGDCTFFEDHLTVEETFASLLQEKLPETQVLNAGAPHYTSAHVFHRFAVDLTQQIRPNQLIFSAGANDVLAFIHHKAGVVTSDYSHLYQSWVSLQKGLDYLDRIPTAFLRLLFCLAWWGRGPITWDRFAESVVAEFRDPDRILQARQLFSPNTFLTSLELFRGACLAHNIQFILATFPYQASDMQEEPRKTYAWGIDQLNQQIRLFAQKHDLPLIDWEAKISFEASDIQNKWHYTRSGNQKRAEQTAEYLNALSSQAGKRIHELAH